MLWLALGAVLGWFFAKYCYAQRARAQQIFSIGLVGAALVYIGFVLIFDGVHPWFWIELAGVFVYGIFAVLGYRGNPLWLAVGWGLHPIWDAALHLWASGANHSPEWYVLACISFDVVVALYIAFIAFPTNRIRQFETH